MHTICVMIWLFVDYISERIERRKYRLGRRAWKEKKPNKMDCLIAELGEKYRFLKNLEDGEEIVRYMRIVSDSIQKDALDRFILSYRQWCRNHRYQYEALTLNRDIYDYNHPAAELPDTGTNDDGKLLTEVYCGEPLDKWDPEVEGDDLWLEEMALL